MITRVLPILAACGLLLLAHGCAGSRPPARRPLSPETCPDAEALPSCEARLDGLSAALADALAPAAESPTAQGQAVMEQQAAAAPSEQAEDADENAEEHAHFAAARKLSHGPDCMAARDLRDRICDLSDAICALGARDGAPREIMDKCTSARMACERARSEVSNACPP